jgi:hypothetical protein
VYLIRTETGWQVVGRVGGSDGRQVTHYFDREADARTVLQRPCGREFTSSSRAVFAVT